MQNHLLIKKPQSFIQRLLYLAGIEGIFAAKLRKTEFQRQLLLKSKLINCICLFLRMVMK
ncbi:hypothetical protein DU80_14330 [Methanosarcina mazei]|uniref:Uncharacterized protein n=1 Tax=Methanosarcina mazei TaxID=2209 RepID=A0A0F8BUS7_METMZ|nr:hypothetical protein DU47_13905 [Methanosarcina mazei]KKH90486.1 hypothetical protein DU80_14330 [Methanosarcina mazei]